MPKPSAPTAAKTPNVATNISSNKGPNPTPPDAKASAEQAATWERQRDLILRMMPPTPTLVAVCLAGVSLFAVHPKLNQTRSQLDDVLAVSAVLFMLSIYLTMWAVRTPSIARALTIATWVIRIFMTALTLLIGMGFVLIYAVA